MTQLIQLLDVASMPIKDEDSFHLTFFQLWMIMIVAGAVLALCLFLVYRYRNRSKNKE